MNRVVVLHLQRESEQSNMTNHRWEQPHAAKDTMSRCILYYKWHCRHCPRILSTLIGIKYEEVKVLVEIELFCKIQNITFDPGVLHWACSKFRGQMAPLQYLSDTDYCRSWMTTLSWWGDKMHASGGIKGWQGSVQVYISQWMWESTKM